MAKTITYAINREDGLVISRMGEFLAWPILNWDRIGQDGDFSQPFEYHLERIRVFDLRGQDYRGLEWTKKIPLELKNRHREFWGLKPLKEKRA